MRFCPAQPPPPHAMPDPRAQQASGSLLGPAAATATTMPTTATTTTTTATSTNNTIDNNSAAMTATPTTSPTTAATPTDTSLICVLGGDGGCGRRCGGRCGGVAVQAMAMVVVTAAAVPAVAEHRAGGTCELEGRPGRGPIDS